MNRIHKASQNSYIFQHSSGLQIVDPMESAASRIGVHPTALWRLKASGRQRQREWAKLGGWAYIGVGPKPTRHATLEWVLRYRKNGPRHKNPEDREDQSPVDDKLLLVLALYKQGHGAKEICKRLFDGDRKFVGIIIRRVKKAGVFESGRKSPVWLGKGPGVLSERERAKRLTIEAHLADQREWKRGVRRYERAIWPIKQHWRIQHNKMRETPELEIKFNLRKRLRHCVIDKQYTLESDELFGIRGEKLVEHFERQFSPGWTWDNYGKVWHIDHKIPCRAFDLTDPEQAKKCFHFTNLQPMDAKENIRKSDKLPDGSRARNAA